MGWVWLDRRMHDYPSREVEKFLLVTAGVVFAMFMLLYMAGLHVKLGFPFDGDDYVIGRDFVNFWMMGHSGLTEPQPAANYDIEVYTAKIRQWLGADYRWHQWSYPPNFILLMLPFALLPYLWSYAVWMVVNVAALLVAVRGRVARALVLLSPASCLGLVSGQVCFLVAAVNIAVFRLLDRRPWLAGMLIGALTIKPQMGLLYPIFLAVTGRWRVFAAATLTALAILGVTAALWGTEILTTYLTLGIPMQNQVLEAPAVIISCLIPTVYMDVWMTGASYQAGMAVQVLVALVALGLFVRHVRRAGLEMQALLFALTSLLVTPYMMAYDLVFLTYTLIAALPVLKLTRAGMWLVVGVYWLTVIHLIAGAVAIPGTALLPLALLVWLGRRPAISSIS